ncbi:hypothetical protein ACJQWK_07225 [Exserohilum turcicum]
MGLAVAGRAPGASGSSTIQEYTECCLARNICLTDIQFIIIATFQTPEMPISTLLSAVLPPCHLLAYSTLLGTELYQTFVMTKVAHRALARPSFVNLQKRVFTIYFKT